MAMSSQSILTTPACLIENRVGKLHVCQPVLEQVKQLDKPLVVVAIVGDSWSGKSYLLNRLIDTTKTEEFGVHGPGQSGTNGIWVLAQPHPVLKDHYLLLLDTQGFGYGPNSDKWIFGLATLLSSVLCFNVHKYIEISDLRPVAFIHKNSAEVTDADYECFFPHFVLTLRDVEKDSSRKTPDQYLEENIQLKKEETEENLSKQCILKYFKNRRCFTFPSSNQQMDEDIEHFRKYIYHNRHVKKLPNGTNINGKMWALLVETCVAAIPKGMVQCVKNVSQKRVLFSEMDNTGQPLSAADEKMKAQTERQLREDAERAKEQAQHRVDEMGRAMNEKTKQLKVLQDQLQEKERLRKEAEDRKSEIRKLQIEEKLKAQKERELREAAEEAKEQAQHRADEMGRAMNEKTEHLKVLQSRLREKERLLKKAEDHKSEIRKLQTEEKRKAQKDRQLREEAEMAMKQAQHRADQIEQTMHENMEQLKMLQNELENQHQHHEEVLQIRLQEEERLHEEAEELKSEIRKLQTDTRQFETVDGYKIFLDKDSLLGCGQFGKVFKGVRDVAVKTVDLGSHEEEHMKYIQREIKALTELDHPNIVKLFHTKQTGQQMYFFTEVCNADLDKFIKQSERFEKTTALCMMIEIASALKYMHELSPPFIHRDIKPGNVLIKMEGSVPHSKLADLGMARNVSDDVTMSSKSVVGTPNYMAPECRPDEHGYQRYHKEVDVFSTGVLFLAMAEAKPGQYLKPIKGQGRPLGEIMNIKTMMKEEFKPPINFDANDDEKTTEVKKTAEMMLQQNPTARPSMSEVFMMLKRLQGAAGLA